MCDSAQLVPAKTVSLRQAAHVLYVAFRIATCHSVPLEVARAREKPVFGTRN